MEIGGWTLRNGRILKSSYLVLNELYWNCQPTETKVQQKNQCFDYFVKKIQFKDNFVKKVVDHIVIMRTNLKTYPNLNFPSLTF
jgi:hypothetical protein